LLNKQFKKEKIVRKRFIAVFAVIIAVVLWTSAGFLSVGSQAATILTEGFEAGGKTAYAAANATLGTGSWNLDDALTGNTTSDRKTGSYSARVRNTGKVTMNFNASSAGTVSVQHAVYGTDGSSTWELYKSTNNSSTWTKVGATVTTSSTSISTASFTVNNAGVIRFEIRKISHKY
jgi:endonuclease G, mitochondrial